MKWATVAPNAIVVKTNATENGLAYISDNYVPQWKAYVDGKETKIFRADYAFRAITIPPGNHTVIFQYFPKTFLIGSVVALVSLLSMFSFAFMPRRFKK